MRLRLSSEENDECSPMDYVAVVATLANEILKNHANDGRGTIFGGSFVLAGVVYQYEVNPISN
jgi:hypothetical protein